MSYTDAAVIEWVVKHLAERYGLIDTRDDIVGIFAYGCGKEKTIDMIDDYRRSRVELPYVTLTNHANKPVLGS